PRGGGAHSLARLDPLGYAATCGGGCWSDVRVADLRAAGPASPDGAGTRGAGRARLRSGHGSHRRGRARAGEAGARGLPGQDMNFVKSAIKRTIASTWGWRILGPILREPGVIVLTYHRILGRDRSFAGLPVETFAAQMRWLREHCDPIAPEAIHERV